MRIRKSASRLLGSAYSASAAPPVGAAPPFDLLPPPPPHLAPCSAPESCSGSGFSGPSASSAEPCELSRSPWDLIAELSLSDPQVEDDIVDKYFVHVTTRSSWLFSATIPAASTTKKKNLQVAVAAGGDSTKLRRDTVKKPAIMSKEKEGDANKKAKVKKEEGQQDAGARVWVCKKNDGKRWHCNRPVSQPNTLCQYHFVQKRSYLNPDFESLSMAELEEAAPVLVPAPVSAAASNKSSTRNKPRKKKPGSDLSATEGFYYYAGFGPFRSKRQCRSGGMNEPVPAKQEEEDHAKDDASPSQQAEVDDGHDDTNQTVTATHADASSCEDDMAGIAGVDEGSSDDDFDGLGISGCSMNGNGDPKASNGDGKRKIPWKRWRKPVKARSLKSLM